ncbi:MAG: gas vesicle protein K [Actinobacteria bacterium]|nr:gas vesicle protein K [Actinomycetota bacterium]
MSVNIPESKVLAASDPVDLLPSEIERISTSLGRRVNATPGSLEKGLAQLVLTIIELLRQLMERQAVRRIAGGTLSDEEVERLGETFMSLAGRMDELKQVFGLTDEDLNLNLGPLGDLL